MAPIKMNIRISPVVSIVPHPSLADVVVIIAWNSPVGKPREQPTLGDLPGNAGWLICNFAPGRFTRDARRPPQAIWLATDLATKHMFSCTPDSKGRSSSMLSSPSRRSHQARPYDTVGHAM